MGREQEKRVCVCGEERKAEGGSLSNGHMRCVHCEPPTLRPALRGEVTGQN